MATRSPGFLLGCLLVFAFSHFFTPVAANGVGMIDAGGWLYRPPCAEACRMAIAKNRLLCGVEPDYGKYADKRLASLNAVVNSPQCYVTDPTFLRTLSLCIADRCSRDGAPVSLIEDWWEGHVATGVQENRALHPNISYQDALRDARQDIAGMSNVPYAVMGQPMNVTSLVPEAQILPFWNGMKWVGRIERDHTKNS